MAAAIALTLTGFAAVWAGCGLLAYGITLAYWDAEHPGWDNTGMAQSTALAGPIGLLVAFVKSDFAKHGLKYK